MSGKNFFIILLVVAAIIFCALYLTKIHKKAPIMDREVPVENGFPAPTTDPDTNSTPQATTPPTIVVTATVDDGAYMLSSFNGTGVTQGNYTLNVSKNTLNAKICNTMNGTYTLQSGILKGTLISTKMYCSSPEITMKIEDAFSKLISSGAKVTVTDTTLTLSNDSTTLVYNKK